MSFSPPKYWGTNVPPPPPPPISKLLRGTWNSFFYVGLAHTLDWHTRWTGTHACPCIAAKRAAVTRDVFVPSLTSSFSPEWLNDSVWLIPRPHYTVFKRKRYCFVPDTATVHTTTVRKRIVSKTLSRVERFENGTVWKRCFPSVDGENDTIWKRWRHHNNTTWLLSQYVSLSEFFKPLIRCNCKL